MARRVLLSFLLLLPVAAAVVAGLHERSDADVRARVMRAIDAESKVSYRAVRTVQFGGAPTRLTLVHQAPDRTRMERLDGSEGPHHGPREHGERPEHSQHGEHGDRGRGHRMGGGGPWRAVPIIDVDLALRSYDATVDGATIRFASKHPGRPTLSMTFDDASGLLLGWEYALPGGTGTFRVATESLDLTTPIAFEETPRDAGRGRSHARDQNREGWRGEEFDPDVDRSPDGFPLLLPRTVPEGFRRIEARLVRRGDRSSARLAWTDGIAVLSIFEFEAGAPGGRWAVEELPRPEAGKVVVERRTQEGTSFLRGRVADTGFVVIGSLGEAELTELISSLEFESVDKEVEK